MRAMRFSLREFVERDFAVRRSLLTEEDFGAEAVPGVSSTSPQTVHTSAGTWSMTVRAPWYPIV
ncbi:MAG TPA: hypothetical protein VG206_03970 [Terriglobia bacterium]|nr:hypothetical protein [Terriglobia bacterium]